MTVASEAEKSVELWPDHELVRRIEVLDGEAIVHVTFDPRPDHGRTHPAFRRDTALGFACTGGPEAIAVQSDIPLEAERGPGVHGQARLRAGERRYVSMTYEQRLPSIVPAIGDPTASSNHPASWRSTTGERTPIVTLIAHVLYGAFLGAFLHRGLDMTVSGL